MKYINLIIILFILSSCTTTKSVVGLYGKCPKSYFACTQIELKADKTFEYYIFMDVGGANIIEGTWDKISKDTIVLNTFKQPYNQKTTYIGRNNPDLKDTVRIKITERNEPMQFFAVKINNGEQEEETDKNGIVEFNAHSIKSIEYSFFLLSLKETIQIDNINYNEIEISLKDLQYSSIPEYITDKVIILKGNKLVFDTDFSLQRINSKNKQW